MGSFHTLTSGGISNTNLFKNWPIEKIANIHKDPIVPETRFCKKYYKLSSKEIGWYFPFNILHKIYKSFYPDKTENIPSKNITQTASVKQKRNYLLSFLRKIVNFLGLEALQEKTVLSKDLEIFLDEFKPEIIYSNLGSYSFTKLVKIISQKYNIPVVLQVTDDWPDSFYRNGISKLFRKYMERDLLHILKQAKLRYTVCEEMSRDYLIRYGLDFGVIISMVNIEEWLPFSKQNYALNETIRIRYLGTIFPLSQKVGLHNVSQAVSELIDEGIKISFEIYTPPVYFDELGLDILKYKGTSLNPAPPNTEAPLLLSSSDLLVIPVNFDEVSFRYNKYSLAGKTFAYMISGTPVLLYGPAEVPHVAYAIRDGWGAVVKENNVETLKEKIKELIYNEKLREQLGNKARTLAVERHDANKVRIEFHEKICNIFESKD